MRYFKDKGYAFVRYDNKESACNAIVALHLTEVAIDKYEIGSKCGTLFCQVGGQVVKCSWGKEGGGSQPSHESHYGGGGGGGYNSNQVSWAEVGWVLVGGQVSRSLYVGDWVFFSHYFRLRY